MNRKEIRERILFLLNDDITDPVFFSAAQVNTMISEGLEILTEEIFQLSLENSCIL